MIATTIMAVIMITWCLVTLIVNGRANDVPWRPDLSPKVEHAQVSLSVIKVDKGPTTYPIASRENVKAVESEDGGIVLATIDEEKAGTILLKPITSGRTSVKITDGSGKVETIDIMVAENARSDLRHRSSRTRCGSPPRSAPTAWNRKSWTAKKSQDERGA